MGKFNFLTKLKFKPFKISLFEWGKGKNFRIDLDTKNGLHYHRRGIGLDGLIKDGQGIGRHRPWDKSPLDNSFWDRW